MIRKVFYDGNRTGRRLIVLVIAFSSLITLALTSVQLFFDYRQQRGDMERVLDDLKVQLPTLSGIVWAFNEKQIDLSLEAVVRLPNVERAQILTSDGHGEWERGSSTLSSHVVKRSYPLHWRVKGTEQQIGTLVVVAKLDEIYQRVFEHALSILLSNAIKTFLVAAFMLVIFNRLVTRRLEALANDVNNLAPRLLNKTMAGADSSSNLPAGSDEFDTVRHSFELMAKELEVAVAALKSHSDHLETTVLERTADLMREKKNLSQTLGELQKILEHASLGIALVISDQNHRSFIVRANKAFENILGYGSSALNGADTSILFENDQARAMVSAASGHEIQHGRSFHGEVTYLHKDGHPVLTETVGTAVDADDLSKGTIWLINDITQRRVAERALAAAKADADSNVSRLSQAHAELNSTLAKLQTTQVELVEREKLAALGALVAGVAHELNTPIGNSLMGASTLFDESVAFKKQLQEGIRRSTLESYVDTAQSASQLVVRNLQRAADLVASFKQVAVDQTSSQRRCFNLSATVSEFIVMLQPSIRKTGFTVEHSIPEEIELDSFPGPLGQTISNLINNAFVHGFEGRANGKVQIEARRIDPNWLELTVRDDGVGIAPEDLPHIFEPFFTTKLGQGGSGLGLNIVRTIITGMMGGQIKVDSTLGSGTTFTLILPVIAPVET